jgi:uncharacterized Rmd1/YagE family protein
LANPFRINCTPIAANTNPNNPLIVRAGANGCVVLLRYGAIVTFNLSMEEESKLLKTIESHIRDPLKATASEVLAIACGNLLVNLRLMDEKLARIFS